MVKRQIPIIAFAVISILLLSVNVNYAFAGETIFMNTLSSGTISDRSVNDLADTNPKFTGEEIIVGSSLINQTINKIIIPLKRGSTASSETVTLGIWNSGITPTASNYLHLIATFPQNGLTTDYLEYNFTFNAYELSEGEAIGVFYLGNVDSSTIFVPRITTDQFDSSNSRWTQYRDSDGVFTDTTTNEFRIALLQVTGSGSINDCFLEENINKLICRLGGDGTLGSAGAFVVGDIENGTGILGIGCSVGLVDCVADSNPQTNGLGILIFIASIFVVLGMFITSLGFEGALKIPTFVYVIIIISLSAFFTITGLIDPVFLILSVVALIALGAPKILGMIKGGSTFGSGSTE